MSKWMVSRWLSGRLLGRLTGCLTACGLAGAVVLAVAQEPPKPPPGTAPAPPSASRAPAENAAANPAGPGAALYPGFSGYARQVTTRVPEAQRWFDQGIQLLYGFNHDEAIRSFERAAELDPSCAMAWWGSAYGRGLHINNPQMGEAQSRLALLLAEGRHAEAEEVYRADLVRHPNNAWSLLGLQQSLQGQIASGRAEDRGAKAAQAEALAAEVQRAWARADVTPIASCYCHPDALSGKAD